MFAFLFTIMFLFFDVLCFVLARVFSALFVFCLYFLCCLILFCFRLFVVIGVCVLSYVALWFFVLCFDGLLYVVLCCVVLCCVSLCCVVLCYVVLCYVMLCCVVEIVQVYDDLLNCINIILLQSVGTRIVINIYIYILQVQYTVYYDWRNSSLYLSFEKSVLQLISDRNTYVKWPYCEYIDYL